MSHTPGTRLGPYEITAPLGAGGMGEVYRARDTALNRDVAIKVLPDSFAGDPDRLARFQREAEALAALNHPNIAQIYGIEHFPPTEGVVPPSGRGSDLRQAGVVPPAGGEEVRPLRQALVLEYVEGPTLAERIRAGPLPLDEALPIARQIAHALEAAHERGIIHRDLKPANIKVKDDGIVKVLDFGLAKAMAPQPGSAAEDDFANSPTITAHDTRHGVILGTAAYMAPEQARGRVVDKRADIWAFGVVLYEMVTGRRLFHGEDLTEIVASVVKDTPDLSTAPREVRRLLTRCLEKDPKKRLRDIGDVWLLLDEAPTLAAEDRRTARSQWVPWLLVATLAVTSLASFFWPESGPTEPLAAVFDVGPAPGTTMITPVSTTAVSPDGRYVVFAATSDDTSSLWLRDLESGETRPLPGTEWTTSTATRSASQSREPFWSPDSRSLAFMSGNTLRRLDVDGGATRTVHEFTTGNRPFGTGSWSADGVILVSRRSNLMRLPAAGGEPELVFPDSDDRSAFYTDPRFLPDSRRFLYYMTSRSDPSVRGLYAGSLDDPDTRVRILETDRQARYVPSASGTGGWLLFIQDQALLAQPFDADRLRLEGEPSVLVEDINVEGTLSGEAGTGGFPGFWVSPAGVLAYRTGTRVVGSRLTWFDRQGQPVGTIGEPGSYSLIALSRDGSQLAASGSVFDVARNSRTRLSTDVEENAGYPVWSPDGREILFHSGSGVFRRSVGIVGSETAILSVDQGCSVPLDWSSDGRFALFSCSGRTGSTSSADIGVLSMTDAAAEPADYLATRFQEGAARFSPDGRWVTYVSDVSGTFEVYVSPFPDASTAPAVMISTAGGHQPRWRPDGRAIWYLTTDLTLMEVPVTIGPDAVPRAGTPEELFPLPTRLPTRPEGWNWDVTPDGQRFVAAIPILEDAGPLTVVMNWEARLRRSGAGR